MFINMITFWDLYSLSQLELKYNVTMFIIIIIIIIIIIAQQFKAGRDAHMKFPRVTNIQHPTKTHCVWVGIGEEM